MILQINFKLLTKNDQIKGYIDCERKMMGGFMWEKSYPVPTKMI